MALVRRLIGAGLAVAVAFAVLLAAFSIFISPDAVRQRVVERAAELTGLQVIVRGKTQLSLFPNLRFELNEVAFLVPDNPDAAPVVTTHELIGVLDLWRLLAGELVPDSLTLVRPRIILVRAPTRVGNWGAGANGQIGRAILAPDEAVPTTARIGRIGIEDGRVVFAEPMNGVREEISSLSGEVSWPRLNGSVEGRLSGVWRGEIFNLGFAANEPLRLMRHGRAGVLFDLSGAGAELRFRGQAVTEFGPQLNGQLTFSSASFRNLADIFGIQLRPGAGLGEASASGNLHLSNGVASLSNARLALDTNRAEGTLEIDFGAPVVNLRGTLALETLDLNAYRSTAAAPGDPAATPLVDTRIREDDLDRLSADVRFSAARVLLGEASFGRTAGTVTSREGSFIVGIAETELYGGIGAGTLNLTADDQGVRWDAVVALDGIEVQSPFQALAGLDELRGLGTLRFNGSGRGGTLRDVMGHLSGKGSVEIANGVLSGIEGQAVAQALASGRLEDLPMAGGGSTSFQRLGARIELQDGDAWIHDLALEAGALVVTGEGRVSLPEARIDGTAAVRLREEPGGTDAIPEMPLVVRGTLAEPRIYPPTRWLMQRASPAAVADPIRLEMQGFDLPLGALLRGVGDLRGRVSPR